MRKTIKVDGGYITFDFSPGIVKKLDDFVLELNEIETGLESGDIAVRTAGKRLARKFDAIFGKNASIKAFGCSAPSMTQFEEFWNKFAPVAEEWMKKGV
jgi:hypothetical protein